MSTFPEKQYKLLDVAKGVWYTIHMAAASQNYRMVKDLIDIFKKTFPCSTCSEHITQYVTLNPIPLEEKLLYGWTIDFHNNVNLRLSKVLFDKPKADLLLIELTQLNTEEECSDCVGITKPNAESAKESIKLTNIAIISY
jgi:hypothetical protein